MDQSGGHEDDDLPELDTRVAIAGARYQAEIGGTVCFDNVIAIAIYGSG